MFYAGFYLMQILLAALTLGTFRWEVLLLAAKSFPIYLRASGTRSSRWTQVARHR